MPTLSLILLWLLNGLLVLAYAAASTRHSRFATTRFQRAVIVKQVFSLSMIQRVKQHSFVPRVHFSVESQFRVADQESQIITHSLAGAGTQ